MSIQSSKCQILPSYSGCCTPEFIPAKWQCQTGPPPHQKYHLNPQGLHRSTQSAIVEQGSSWPLGAFFLLKVLFTRKD